MSRPLLSADLSSENSEEQADREDAALLGNSDEDDDISNRTTRYNCREIGLFIWALLATTTVIVLATLYSHQQTIGRIPKHAPNHGKPSPPSGKKNLIFMVSDGMGPVSSDTLCKDSKLIRREGKLVLDEKLQATQG